MERALKVLEFEKIIEQLKGHASSSLGLEKIESLRPSIDFAEVERWQAETDEGAKVIRLRGNVPFGGIHDVRTALKRSKIGGNLNASELLDISETIRGGRRLQTFIEKMVEDEIELPLLQGYINQLSPAGDLEKAIRNCIDEYGEILDSASPALQSIRRQIKTSESKVREKLEGMTRSANTRKMLSDAVVTIRNDRYVLPVKQEYRGNFGGIVHDQSSSGATLFIEPGSIVEINNRLREAKLKEAKEIEKILAELTAETAEMADSLLHNVKMLQEIEFIFAKSRYANQLKATRPVVGTDGYLQLKKARHPLIPEIEAVPIDVELGEAYSSLIITGPNTGGKTVTLKTIGLLTLMVQAGLQIPVEEGSRATIFQSVFADIGDEQSIEQNLSTFSSHMTNIIEILKKVDHNSLVLFDELGAGTDPQEGAALAIAILDHVYNFGARVVATTHYSELKAYAYEREGILNASVEFDVETLKPTYRLLIGIPGRSNAFDISSRLGMEAKLIEAARKHVSSDTNKVDNMIASLESNQKKAENERREAEKILRETEALRGDLEKKVTALERERETVLKEADRKAKQAVASAKREAEAIIEELREAQKHGASVKDHELIEARRRLEGAAPDLMDNGKTLKGSGMRKKRSYQPGDEVKVESLNQKGHIVEKLAENEYVVQLGIMKMNVKPDDLVPMKSQKAEPDHHLVSVRGASSHVKTELDLRGTRYEDAMEKVEKYLDDALLAGYHQVSIIHGKGTGALRKGVAKLLKSHSRVKGSRMGTSGEGGSGVTVVQLK